MLKMPIKNLINNLYLVSGQVPDQNCMHACTAFINIKSYVKRNISFTFCPLDAGNGGNI